MSAELITHTLTVRGLDSASVCEVMADALRKSGYTVLPPGAAGPREDGAKYERPAKIAARLGLHVGTVARKLALPVCPPFRANRGLSGRIISVAATPELEAFLCANKGVIRA